MSQHLYAAQPCQKAAFTKWDVKKSGRLSPLREERLVYGGSCIHDCSCLAQSRETTSPYFSWVVKIPPLIPGVKTMLQNPLWSYPCPAKVKGNPNTNCKGSKSQILMPNNPCRQHGVRSWNTALKVESRLHSWTLLLRLKRNPSLPVFQSLLFFISQQRCSGNYLLQPLLKGPFTSWSAGFVLHFSSYSLQGGPLLLHKCRKHYIRHHLSYLLFRVLMPVTLRGLRRKDALPKPARQPPRAHAWEDKAVFCMFLTVSWDIPITLDKKRFLWFLLHFSPSLQEQVQERVLVVSCHMLLQIAHCIFWRRIPACTDEQAFCVYLVWKSETICPNSTAQARGKSLPTLWWMMCLNPNYL